MSVKITSHGEYRKRLQQTMDGFVAEHDYLFDFAVFCEGQRVTELHRIDLRKPKRTYKEIPHSLPAGSHDVEIRYFTRHGDHWITDHLGIAHISKGWFLNLDMPENLLPSPY